VDALTEDARARSGVPVRGGAYIANVKRGSPAELAGLPIGGVIVRMDSRTVSSANDLVDAIKAARPGQRVEVMYYDRGRPYRKVVELASSGGGEAGSGDARSGNPIAAPPSSGGSPTTGEGLLRGAPGALGNRPMLRNLGQMAADTIGRPGALSTVYDPSVVAALQSRVVELTVQTKQLEERIRTLESKLGGSSITPGGSSTTPSLTPPASATPASPSFGAPSGPGFGPALGTGTNP
jgi:membrane-associated protease RseP (regulator of RpoE activity)